MRTMIHSISHAFRNGVCDDYWCSYRTCLKAESSLKTRFMFQLHKARPILLSDEFCKLLSAMLYLNKMTVIQGKNSDLLREMYSLFGYKNKNVCREKALRQNLDLCFNFTKLIPFRTLSLTTVGCAAFLLCIIATQRQYNNDIVIKSYRIHNLMWPNA